MLQSSDVMECSGPRSAAGPEAVALPSGEGKVADVQPVKVEEVDADLEELKRSIDKL